MRQHTNTSPENYTVDTDAPLTNFNHCHIGILNHIDRLSELPALLGPAMLAQKIASQAVEFFHRGMFAHHQEEERELFPAVQHSANMGEERALEQLREGRERALKKVAKGQETHLDMANLQALVERYTAHADAEERVFLPLAEKILGRNSNHMAALGLSLHMRHAPRILSHI